MAVYQIDTDVWTTPKQYGIDRKVSKQLVYWWMNNNQLVVRRIDELGIVLVKKGEEKGSAIPKVVDVVTKSNTKSTNRVSRKRTVRYRNPDKVA